MKQALLKYLNKNKIVVGILLFFLIWMLFFDEYNWLRIRKDQQKLDALQEEKVYLKQKIADDRQQLKDLQNDTDKLEKFAREKYLLKKENEDVYVIIEEEE